jgi:hypothetical protein
MARVLLLFAVAGVGNIRIASMASDLPCGAGLPSDDIWRGAQSSHHSSVLPSPISFTAGVGSKVTAAFSGKVLRRICDGPAVFAES